MSSCRVVSQTVGGVWLRDYSTCYVLQKMATCTCTWPTTLPSFSTATACRLKEFSSSTAQQSFIDLSTRIRRGGGFKSASPHCYAPLPLFPESRSQKGGGIAAGQYGTCTHLKIHVHVRTLYIHDYHSHYCHTLYSKHCDLKPHNTLRACGFTWVVMFLMIRHGDGGLEGILKRRAFFPACHSAKVGSGLKALLLVVTVGRLCWLQALRLAA